MDLSMNRSASQTTTQYLHGCIHGNLQPGTPITRAILPLPSERSPVWDAIRLLAGDRIVAGAQRTPQ